MVRRRLVAAALAAVVALSGCGSSGDDADELAPRVTLGTPIDTGPATITVVPPTTPPPSTAIPTTAIPTTVAPTTSATTTTTTTTTTTSTTTTTTSTTTTTTSTTVPEPVPEPLVVATPASAAVTTSCRSVGLVGDSTAVGLDGATGALTASESVISTLGAIGVETVRLDVSGGRSIVETLPDQTNGPQAMASMVSAGFDGCWVILLGTNDAANIAAGSNAGVADRVQRVLDAAAGLPVLWVTASTVRGDGFWARPNTIAWNNELIGLLAGRPAVAVADWDALASQNPWFVSDGIHPNTAGLRARAAFIADALRANYPA